MKVCPSGIWPTSTASPSVRSRRGEQHVVRVVLLGRPDRHAHRGGARWPSGCADALDEPHHLVPELEAPLLRVRLGCEERPGLQEQPAEGPRVGPFGVQCGQGPEAGPHEHRRPVGRTRSQDARQHVLGERTGIPGVRGVAQVAWSWREQDDAHRRQPPLADHHPDEVGEVGVLVQLGAVVRDQHRQRLLAVGAGRRPDERGDLTDRRVGQRHVDAMLRQRLAVEPRRRAVTSQLEHRLGTERPRGLHRVAWVEQVCRVLAGASLVGEELVLDAVHRRHRPAQLPAGADPCERHRSRPEVEVVGQPNIRELAVRVGEPEDDRVALHGRRRRAGPGAHPREATGSARGTG